ncbi:tetratricopeptide repeat protein [Tenacibaculum sp. S7007]|uniref:Tetratricopeptide repeat protein n=1 Tax=Tenacibaculum pelagium TaxID=2759527 RepID=A0A839AKH5_9FLAO|nr:tetratricopeptide repeat protein [Tenacibaculum pelagium]MBA6154918.1 tetratricopeptide repeat protein [Tenacibaculum pelagium]
MRLFLLVVFYTVIGTVFGQVPQDSLVIELRGKVENAQNDSVKVHYLIKLTKKVEKSNIGQGRELIMETLGIINDIEIPNDYFLKQKASILDALGKYESRQINYQNSLNFRLQALKIREALKDSIEIAKSYHSMGMLFRYQKEYDKSKFYFLKSLEIQKKNIDSAQFARTYNMLGVSYYYNKQNDSAMYCYKLSRNYYPTAFGKTRPNENIAAIYYTTGNYERAIEIYKKNLALYKSEENNDFIINVQMHLAKIHSDLGRHQQAIHYIDKTLFYAKKYGNTSKLPLIYQLRSHIFEKMGNYRYALGYYKTHKYYYDSIFNVKNAKKITELELNYKFQKEKQADSLQFANEKQALELMTEVKQARNRLYIVVLLSISILGITLLIIVNNRRRLNRERFKKEQFAKELLDEQLKHTTYQAKQLVADNKMRLQFKQEFLTKLKKVKKHGDDVDASGFQSLIVDLTSQIQTESKFDSIGDNIEQLDKEFNEKLRIQYPDLTKSEREICALMRMNLSIKEIMIIRNVSMGSVKASRHRIRKKMGLERGQELEQAIMELV